MYKPVCRSLLFAMAAFLCFGTLPAKAQEPVVQSSDFFVATTDNVAIHVHRKIAANPAKVPVLLIHGTWCDGRVWDFPGRSVMDYLAVRGYDVYALDMRGMGQSVYSQSFLNISLQSRLLDAQAVASQIVANTGRAPVVIGWSQGGVITALLATSSPQLVAGVGLFSIGAGPFVVPPQFAPIVPALEQLFSNQVYSFPLTPDQFYALAFGTDPITGQPTMSPAAFANFVSLDFPSPAGSDPESILAIFQLAGAAPFFSTSPAVPNWGAIQVPALVVDGALDPLVGADNAQALYDALGSARKQLMVFPRNGHGWFLEDNFDATQRVLNRFLSQF